MSNSLRSTEIRETVISDGYTHNYKLIKDTNTSPPSYSFFVSVENEYDYYDEALVKDVTSSEESAYEIFSLITEGTVTPMTIKEILEDLLV